MAINKRGSGRRTGRPQKNRFTTRSGKVIKVHRGLVQRWVTYRDNLERHKADRMNGMPKSRFKRFFYRLRPKNLAAYWFSREGGIMALKVLGIGLIAGFLLTVGVFAYFRKDLPNLKDISGNNIGGSMRYYDKTGKTLLWEDYDAVKRIPVQNDDIAQSMKDATVAVEDKDFFKHGGFDVRGIIRAGWNDAVTHNSTQGGSTITQQLVKLTQDWSGDRTVTRKVKELILAVELERSYSKQEILTGYLNTAPYGGIEYGVEAASRDYFQKSAKDLTLDEAAMLAAIPKSPRYYSPYNVTDFDKDAFLGRQHYILDLMAQQGKITKKQAEDAKKVDTLAKVKQRQSKYTGIKAPWFVLAAKKQLEDKYGDKTVKRGGWTVITTLDLNLQAIAEDEVHKGLAQVRRQGGDTAAFAAEDVKTGQMVALVGGGDFNNPDYGQINYAQTPLPPGSSFKPYDYTALIEKNNNFGAGSVLYDSQGPLDGYPCTDKSKPVPYGDNSQKCLWDYDFRYPGPLTLRYALGGSRNVPAVKAMLTTGIDATRDVAQKMGLKSGYNCYLDENFTKQGPCYAASAIGDGAYVHLDEHVHGYATISRNGVNLPQTYILKITDSGNKIVDEWKPTKGEQAVRPDAAYIVADMLSDPNASYFPSSRKPHRYKGWKFAMKTGTTDEVKDGWMMGFSPQYAAGVWVGYHTRRIAMHGFMEDMTQPIWQGWMDRAHDNIQPFDRARPSDLQVLPAFVVRSHVGIGSIEPSPSTDLFPSWYQQPKKTNGGKQTIDVISNKLATDCTPTLARKDVTDADANAFSGDRFYGNANVGDQQDDVHKCDDAKPSVQITGAPSSCGSSCTITVTTTAGTHDLSTNDHRGVLNVIIDGQTVQSFGVDSPGANSLTFDYSGSGSKQVTVQVIDSVLYDSSDAANISFTGSSVSSVSVVSPTAGQSINSGNTTITWTGGTGPYTVHFKTGAGSFGSYCINTSGTSCPVSLSGPPGTTYQVYIEQSGGGASSSTISFTKGP